MGDRHRADPARRSDTVHLLCIASHHVQLGRGIEGRNLAREALRKRDIVTVEADDNLVVTTLKPGIERACQPDVGRHDDRLDIEGSATIGNDGPRSISDWTVLNQNDFRRRKTLPKKAVERLLQMTCIIAPVGRHQYREFPAAQSRPFNPVRLAEMP